MEYDEFGRKLSRMLILSLHNVLLISSEQMQLAHFMSWGFLFGLFLLNVLLLFQIQTPIDCLTAIYTVLSRRRGHVTSDVPQPGTPAYIVKVMEALCLPSLPTDGFI
jgi:hypothetical protein